MPQKVTKAIFPVAGLGTRFLPATKSIPKEIMTLVDRPLIQYAIDEARAAGITEFIFVTAKGKSALEDYFDGAPELEEFLRRRGKTELLELLKATDMESGAIAYVRQRDALGLGHAVWCARRLIGDEPFAVMLPDDVILGQPPCLKQMVAAHAVTGGCYVAAMDVAPEEAPCYGMLDILDDDGRCARIAGMVEKPAVDVRPSNTAAIGRYILTPAIMRHLEQIPAGAGGELQLTDAIAREVATGGPVYGFRFDGERYDCGSKLGYIRATLALALERPEMRAALSRHMQDLLQQV